MKDTNKFTSPISYLAAFVMGVILFLSVGKDWFLFEGLPVFLAGLIGICLAVLLARPWELYHSSRKARE